MAVTVTYAHQSVVSDFQTNTYETGNQLMPDVLGLTTGGFVSAYNNVDVADGFIAVDFYDDAYQVVGAYQLAYSSNTDAYYQPKLAELANGNILVVWDDDNGVGSEAGPHASIYTPAGAVVAEDIELFAASNSPDFNDVDIGVLDDGKFVVTYEFEGDIFFRLFNANGVEVVANDFTQVNNVGILGVQDDSQITVMADGAFAVTWTDSSPADAQIRGRIFEFDGAARTGEFLVSPGVGDNTKSSVAARLGGGFAVAYTDSGWAEGGTLGNGITLQLVDADGDLGAIAWVTDPGTVKDETDADVTVLPNGFIVVTWTFPDNPLDHDIYGRVFSPAGVAVTAAFTIAAGAVDEFWSAVSGLSDGRFITSWTDETADASMGSIASQISEIVRTSIGDGLDNVINGDLFRDNIQGAAGEDALHGHDGADTIDGGGEADIITGGAGNDVLQGGTQNDTITGGFGNDRIFGATQAAPAGSVSGDALYGNNGKDRISCAQGSDTVQGGDGDDRITGRMGFDRLSGQDGSDKLKGQTGNDTLEGGLQGDTLSGGVGQDLLYANSESSPDGSTVGDTMSGGNGRDTMHGSGGADTMLGVGGNDRLNGHFGADTLAGGVGKDRLNGGLGGDSLQGGADRDIFIYASVLDSQAGDEDTIIDLVAEDVVNLAAIDAKSGKPGNQAFDLVEAFSGEAGELVLLFNADGPYSGFTTIQGDVDGDSAADFTIKVLGDLSGFTGIVL